MAESIKVIRARDFLETTPEGEHDLNSSKKVLLELANVNRVEVPNNILIDIRRVQWKLSAFDVYDLAIYLVEKFWKSKIKIAVLAMAGTSFERAEFLELCARNRGIVMDTFTNFEDAVHWFFDSELIVPNSLGEAS